MRSIVIAIGACTDSNYQQNYKLPGYYAPTASFSLLFKAYQAALDLNINVEVGNVLTSDVFYVDDEKDFASWAKMGVLAVEMETAALYMNAARAGKHGLSILTVSDNIVFARFIVYCWGISHYLLLILMIYSRYLSSWMVIQDMMMPLPGCLPMQVPCWRSKPVPPFVAIKPLRKQPITRFGSCL